MSDRRNTRLIITLAISFRVISPILSLSEQTPTAVRPLRHQADTFDDVRRYGASVSLAFGIIFYARL